jgi:hypothetical protein
LTKSAEAHTLALCLSSAQQWNVVVMLTFIRSSGPPLYTRLVLYQSAELMHTLDRSSALADMQECSFEACPTRFRELLMSAAAAAPTNSHVTTLDLQCHRRLATADVPCWGRLTGAQGRPECNLLAELSTVLPESASQSARTVLVVLVLYRGRFRVDHLAHERNDTSACQQLSMTRQRVTHCPCDTWTCHILSVTR